jgi:hypothetical protein
MKMHFEELLAFLETFAIRQFYAALRFIYQQMCVMAAPAQLCGWWLVVM